MSEECDHKFVYIGLVYRAGDRVPGSGAQEILYSDKFFCEKCLISVLTNQRPLGNTYSKPIEGAIPE